jgi:hypothetical protein
MKTVDIREELFDQELFLCVNNLRSHPSSSPVHRIIDDQQYRQPARRRIRMSRRTAQHVHHRSCVISFFCLATHATHHEVISKQSPHECLELRKFINVYSSSQHRIAIFCFAAQANHHEVFSEHSASASTSVPTRSHHLPIHDESSTRLAGVC